MERFGYKYKRTVILLAVVFALLFAAVLFFSRGLGSRQSYIGEHPLRISELMARNSSVPNADGVLCDWIEIYNGSSGDFNISGYKLSDDITGAKYSFPTGTVVPAGGYLVLSCSTEYTGDLYAPFGLSSAGGETVVLMNAANVIIDRVDTVSSRKNTSMVRREDGSLSLSAAPTPGYENSEAGYTAYLAACGESNEFVRISEVVTANSFYTAADGALCDFVELHNSGASSADISGYMLSDTLGSYTFSFPSGTIIPPDGYLVVLCSEDYTGAELCAPFALSKNGGETVILTGATAVVLDHAETPALKDNQALARVDGEWTVLGYATPGYENSEAGCAAWQASTGYGDSPVFVSEAACTNIAMVPDADGDFSDWLELCNPGSTGVDISGWYLSDDPAQPDKWRIPDGTSLGAGECLLVFASGKNRSEGELHADFSLSAGESVCLSTPSGQLHSSLALTQLAAGETAVNKGGEWSATAFATPGYPNTDEGYERYQSVGTGASALQIYEVCVANTSLYYQDGVGYSDWVELKNVSNAPVELSDYTLSDDWEVPDKWRLPSGTLAPGKSVLYFCAGDEAYTAPGFVHTSFALNAVQDGLYLYETGSLCDWAYLHDIPVGGSYGRMDGQEGFFYFAQVSPQKQNTDGLRGISPTPAALSADGVFNGVESVQVELAADGPIYYTTDGSEPTAESTLYTGPFTVNETTVIRASCVMEGKLTGTPLTLSYIINENHSLPVVSLVSDPGNLFFSGIYDTFWSGKEVDASISLYEADGGFTQNCGIKMYGHTALFLNKRSFKLMFRSSYDGALQYDVFDSDIQYYSSLVLRAGQDYPFAIIRDELFGNLCEDFSDKVLVQDNKYCVMYLNGEYWGIYCLKEAFSEEYYASHRGVDPESVTLEQAPVSVLSPFREVMEFTWTHDMSLDENYEAFCNMVDIDSLIDWCIIEGYSANADVQQNLRYFRSPQNGNRWELAFYDLDWAFYYDVNNLAKVFAGTGESGETLQHTQYIAPLLKNEEFCDRFCRRLAEALAGPLSDESVLGEIDALEALLEPEAERERARWGGSVASWHGRVQELRNFVNNNWMEKIIDGACLYCGLDAQERREYFGGLTA